MRPSYGESRAPGSSITYQEITLRWTEGDIEDACKQFNAREVADFQRNISAMNHWKVEVANESDPFLKLRYLDVLLVHVRNVALGFSVAANRKQKQEQS